MKVFYASAALLLVVAPFAIAQKKAMATKMVTATDKTFMNNAAHSNMAEISMAMIAKQKSKNPEVLRFADMMISDHKMMQSELKALAGQRETQVPDMPNPKQKAVAAKLKSMSGMAFDKMYIQANVTGHKEAYALATKASKNAKDAAVRGYFQKGAPKIKMHLDMAQRDLQLMMSGKPMKGMSGMKGM